MTTPAIRESTSLTRFPTASFRELLVISLPLMLVLLSTSLMGFVDRWFLSQHSREAMEAGVNAVYLCMLFQIPCMRITSIAQIFVGQHKGAGNPSRMSEPVWQMIWFSLFTMCLTLPFSSLGEQLFLGGTAIHATASKYFRFLMYFNFLFPLNAALSSFFLGQGKTKIVTLTMLSGYTIHFLLDSVLIFGVSGIIPPLGILGAAIASATAQLFSCTVLFIFFIKKDNREKFGSSNWRINKESMLKCIKIGLPRALTKFLLLGSWTAIARIMIVKGEDYLLILTIGGTLNLLFSFFNEGMCQATITIASNIVGARNLKLVKKLFCSSLLFVMIESLLLSLPFLIFPEYTISIFFKNGLLPTQQALLIKSCHWLWLFFLFDGIGWVHLGLLTAFEDTVFILLYNACGIWIFGYFPVYYSIKMQGFPADRLWLIMASSCFVAAIFYFSRLLYRLRISRELSVEHSLT